MRFGDFKSRRQKKKTQVFMIWMTLKSVFTQNYEQILCSIDFLRRWVLKRIQISFTALGYIY